MQAASRTPNSILRKRPNKENEDAAVKAAKRKNLRERRVSFAPDDELETKHIFKEDFSRDDRNSPELRVPSPLDPAGISAAAGATDMMPPAQLYSGHGSGEPPSVLPSPGALSPLSMDLTNNSFEQGHMAAAMAQASGHPGLAGALLPAQHQQQYQHADFTRNITMNVPNLSTLVEEDEEEYAAADAVSGGVASAGGDPESPLPDELAKAGSVGDGLGAPSPISPYVLREMQRGGNGGGGDDEVRNRWGFTPGADDTLEVSYGRAVMGEQTYNHVYGGTTTGDLTKAIKDGHTGGHHYGQHGNVTRALAAITAARTGAGAAGSPGRGQGGVAHSGAGPSAAASARDGHSDMDVSAGHSMGAPPAAAPPPQQQQLGRQGSNPLQHQMTQPFQVPMHAPAPLPHNTPFLDNTTKLLEDDQTDAWRLPGAGNNYDRGRLSVASNKVLAPGGRRAAAAGPAGGETTMLLGATTQLLATGGNATAQLLADTTNHKAAYDRFMRNRQAPPSAAPMPRPGTRGGLADATAVSSSAAELRRLAAQDNTNMSMDLSMSPCGQAANGTSNDLLADAGGLSLDAFQLPPEPTVNLSQQQPQMHMQLMAPPAAPPIRPAAPQITCQEFLSFIDVSFNDKVCRTSYLPQSDPPPKTVAEVYEAAVVTAPQVTAYQSMMTEVSSRLANMQSRVQQLEAELSGNNPELFAAVQTVPAAQLETIKDQFISLKKLCRIRTVKAIKQTHLNSLDELLSQLSNSKGKLQTELAAMTADVERLNKCTQDKTALTAAIACRCAEDDAQHEAALQRRKLMDGHLQRLEALRSQNAQRRQRMVEERAERQAVEQNRAPKETLEQERSMLEARISALSVRSSSSAMTPGREGELVKQVAAKREEAEALLGLHAMRIDLSSMDTTGSFNFVFRGSYRVTCTSEGGLCSIQVERLEGTGKPGALAPSVEAALGASAAELSCQVPRAQLALRAEAISRQLHRLWRLAQQLETSWLTHNCLQRPVVEDASSGASGGPNCTLVLSFLNADTVTKVAIRMPWRAALRSDTVAPVLSVSIRNLDPEDMQRQASELVNATVLSRVPPGPGYLASLCLAMSVTLQVPTAAPGGGAGGSSGPDAAASLADGAAEGGVSGTPRAGDRVFNNPLFGGE
ncbi:hypothetical protein HYH02_004117 [Chlamydomonas schloesseri]|uniref:Spc7 kinetochore protein domain-containing protein n=1 Tax=Chlamydomonas schloesseri TaxID=2026947 RepID=A0A835WQF3_9CHLO|nr:hypothetical protein HYH02_004117 [Chlamydomonas schloesseri]|eukprot:KAG2451519.1 hypothetical protein HYH02_004117 [Chlamydomonas schloesseri]